MSTTVAELYAFMQTYGGPWMDISGKLSPIHMRIDAHNVVATVVTTHLLEQRETIHMIHMMHKEACSGGMEDLGHVRTQYCLADCLTKSKINLEVLIKAVKTSHYEQPCIGTANNAELLGLQFVGSVPGLPDQ
eukprot:6463042-Amphidinium_carterae.1